MRRVKIKSWQTLGRDCVSRRSFFCKNDQILYGPIGQKPINYTTHLMLPKDRIIEVHDAGNSNNYYWPEGGFKIGRWTIEPDATDDQAKAYGG